jgi:hypothetical protein
VLKKIKADPGENPAELAGWESQFPTVDYKIVNGQLVEIPVARPGKVAGEKKRR